MVLAVLGRLGNIWHSRFTAGTAARTPQRSHHLPEAPCPAGSSRCLPYCAATRGAPNHACENTGCRRTPSCGGRRLPFVLNEDVQGQPRGHAGSGRSCGAAGGFVSPSERGGERLVGDGPRQGHRALRWRSAMAACAGSAPASPGEGSRGGGQPAPQGLTLQRVCGHTACLGVGPARGLLRGDLSPDTGPPATLLAVAGGEDVCGQQSV